MRIRYALVVVAALALVVPGGALAHKGGSGSGHKTVKHELRGGAKKHVRIALDHRIDRWWRAHYARKRHQSFDLEGQQLVLTGHGKLGSRTITQPETASTTLRAWRGVVKVWALSDDVKVACKGRGYKRSWTKKNGVAVTKCKGIGTATVTGKNFMVYFRAKLGQATFPELSAGTIHTWGRWFAGPEMPEDPDDVVLEEKATDEVTETA